MKGGITFYYALRLSFVWHSGERNPQTWFCFRVRGSLEQSVLEEMEDPRSHELVDAAL